MKKNLHTLLLTASILSTAGLSANIEHYLQEMGTPEGTETFSSEQILKRKGHHWATYKQAYGIENVEVKFPKQPTFAKEKNVVFTFAERKDILYTMVTSSPPTNNINAKHAFSVAIAALCEYPNCLIGYKTSKEGAKHILDTTSQDYETGIVTKARMIVTRKNFYILRTIFQAGKPEKHDYFIESFKIK